MWGGYLGECKNIYRDLEVWKMYVCGIIISIWGVYVIKCFMWWVVEVGLRKWMEVRILRIYMDFIFLVIGWILSFFLFIYDCILVFSIVICLYFFNNVEDYFFFSYN